MSLRLAQHLTIVAGLCILVGTGCVSAEWNRSTQSEAVPVAWSELEIGTSDLSAAIERLGAPLYVYEYETHGLALVWGQNSSDENGFRLSVPVGDDGSASLQYGEGQSGLRGVLLLFDANWRLSVIREGSLQDLTAGRTLRPALPTAQPTAAREEIKK